MSLETFYSKEVTIGSYVLIHNCESVGVNKELDGHLGIVSGIEDHYNTVYYKVLAPYYNRVITLMLKPENIRKVTLDSIKPIERGS